jgi:AraC-like DNA-binding protein/mannose-6-phosphate isomerase-like protein (cupin superfamily)
MLLDLIKGLSFEPFVIDHLIDAHGRFRLDLDPQFPFAIKLYRFPQVANAFPMNWHERLEIFIPLSGSGQFRMGERVIDFSEDDVIVVDNLKLHGLGEFRRKDGLGMTITFNPELVYNIGSPLSDFAYLIPFHCQSDRISPVVRRGEPLAGPIHAATARLVHCYFDRLSGRNTQMGCKAYLLELLFHLSGHFAGAEVVHSEYVKQQERARRLGRLVDHVRQHYAAPMSIAQASRMVGMSGSSFMKFFKQATGRTFVSYLTHVRLSQACELLRNSDRPVAEIAAAVGLPDHPYFDRKFKQYFRTSPRAMRAQWLKRPRV